MDLAKAIGANPNKFMGTKTNITFLGKGPTKNPLFQSRLAGLENASAENLGKPETLFAAIEDAVGWAKDGKLNGIQTEILGHNLTGIERILHPPPLRSAQMIKFPHQGAGIRSLQREVSERTGQVFNPRTGEMEAIRRFPKETHKFMGRPLKDKDFSEIDRMVMEGKIPDARGRTWNLKETGAESIAGDTAAFGGALNVKTGMARAISRQLLLQDTRLKLKPEELFMLKEGKGEPLDLMRKYYGKSMMNLDAWLDDFLPRTNLPPRDLASRILNEVELIPQFARGGLARILEI